MVGVGILYTTTEAKVVRNFMLACACADIGHLYVTYAVMYVSSTSIYPTFERCSESFVLRGSIKFLK